MTTILRVRVNDELVLDAGRCEEVPGPQGPEWLIHPPETTLFQQVLAYLRAQPDPPKRPHKPAREGAATALQILRWGSYLAVLADRDKPLWPEARSAITSRISDQEMARINIEASAALAEWIDLWRDGEELYNQIVERALVYLPSSGGRRSGKVGFGPFAALADPELSARLVHLTEPVRLESARVEARRTPSRVFANALVNVAWRNGPVENIHAGEMRGYPLGLRRVTPAEERALMRFAGDGMALGIAVHRQLLGEQPPRSWPEQVLPYGLAQMMAITPSGWTLTEVSRAVRLPQ